MHPFKEMSVERERKKRQNTSKCHKVRVTKTGITRDKILMSRHTDRDEMLASPYLSSFWEVKQSTTGQ